MLHGYIIVIKRNGEDGTRFPLSFDYCLFGKSQDCDIRIQLPNVAKQHCRLEISEGNCAKLRLLSPDSNYVFVNDKPVKNVTQLQHQDIIRIIDRMFRFEYPAWSVVPSKNEVVGGTPKSGTKKRQSLAKQTESTSNENICPSPKNRKSKSAMTPKADKLKTPLRPLKSNSPKGSLSPIEAENVALKNIKKSPKASESPSINDLEQSKTPVTPGSRKKGAYTPKTPKNLLQLSMASKSIKKTPKSSSKKLKAILPFATPNSTKKRKSVSNDRKSINNSGKRKSVKLTTVENNATPKNQLTSPGKKLSMTPKTPNVHASASKSVLDTQNSSAKKITTPASMKSASKRKSVKILDTPRPTGFPLSNASTAKTPESSVKKLKGSTTPSTLPVRHITATPKSAVKRKSMNSARKSIAASKNSVTRERTARVESPKSPASSRKSVSTSASRKSRTPKSAKASPETVLLKDLAVSVSPINRNLKSSSSTPLSRPLKQLSKSTSKKRKTASPGGSKSSMRSQSTTKKLKSKSSVSKSARRVSSTPVSSAKKLLKFTPSPKVAAAKAPTPKSQKLSLNISNSSDGDAFFTPKSSASKKSPRQTSSAKRTAAVHASTTPVPVVKKSLRFSASPASKSPRTPSKQTEKSSTPLLKSGSKRKSIQVLETPREKPISAFEHAQKIASISKNGTPASKSPRTSPKKTPKSATPRSGSKRKSIQVLETPREKPISAFEHAKNIASISKNGTPASKLPRTSPKKTPKSGTPRSGSKRKSSQLLATPQATPRSVFKKVSNLASTSKIGTPASGIGRRKSVSWASQPLMKSTSKKIMPKTPDPQKSKALLAVHAGKIRSSISKTPKSNTKGFSKATPRSIGRLSAKKSAKPLFSEILKQGLMKKKITKRKSIQNQKSMQKKLKHVANSQKAKTPARKISNKVLEAVSSTGHVLSPDTILIKKKTPAAKARKTPRSAIKKPRIETPDNSFASVATPNIPTEIFVSPLSHQKKGRSTRFGVDLSLTKSPEADYSNVSGLKNLMRTPRRTPKADYTNVSAVKRVMKTPAKSPIADYTNVVGVKRLMRTPTRGTPIADYSNVTGVKRVMKTPKDSPKADYTNVFGMKRLMRTPAKSPKADYTNVAGLKRLVKTPQKSPLSDYTNVDGVAALMMTPKSLTKAPSRKSAVVSTPKVEEQGSPKATRSRRGGAVKDVETKKKVPARAKSKKEEKPVEVLETQTRSSRSKKKEEPVVKEKAVKSAPKEDVPQTTRATRNKTVTVSPKAKPAVDKKVAKRIPKEEKPKTTRTTRNRTETSAPEAVVEISKKVASPKATRGSRSKSKAEPTKAKSTVKKVSEPVTSPPKAARSTRGRKTVKSPKVEPTRKTKAAKPVEKPESPKNTRGTRNKVEAKPVKAKTTHKKSEEAVVSTPKATRNTRGKKTVEAAASTPKATRTTRGKKANVEPAAIKPADGNRKGKNASVSKAKAKAASPMSSRGTRGKKVAESPVVKATRGKRKAGDVESAPTESRTSRSKLRRK